MPPLMRSHSLRSAAICVMVLLLAFAATPRAGAQTFSHSRVAPYDGQPTLLVDGRPFFFYGAAFFYERMPAGQWRASMLATRKLGFNTLDLYVPWNWHELADADFDFSGRSNPRRNLRAVLALARELDFNIIVRPGPVIRNEWRNGGYPAWLLARPDYGMPLHDIFEGRYPATATLQNANSDDAAAQWLANTDHLHYARRWLQTVLREFRPVADRVIAVQLDDDQGAYIDNQTWPAPHLQAYLRLLEATVRSVVGPQLPVFINTYEMKVTASAPVWAMGNWYQSDAYAIGEHDRAALEFSTGLLQTQTRYPVAISEFQAGWLAQPEDPAPRPADPANTTLALHTLLGLGARGTIDFPAQDTLNPAGWEAPFANMAYAWDAALNTQLTPSARYRPTARFGSLVQRYGNELAAARRATDGAIAYLPSAYDELRLTNADVFAIAARTQIAQHACRLRHLTCDLVDLRYISDAALRQYPFVIVPQDRSAGEFVAPVAARLERYRARGGQIRTQPPDVVTPRNGGIPDATLLLASGETTAFLDLLNYDRVARHVPRTRITLPHERSWFVGPLTVPARDALLLRGPLTVAASTRGVRLHASVRGVAPAPTSAPCPPGADESSAGGQVAADAPRALVDDRDEDGFGRLTLDNGLVSVTLAPAAGARAFRFAAAAHGGCPADNVFTSVGSLRDDVEIQPPLSTTDRIGKYTRSFPAGMFNRLYRIDRRAADSDSASVQVTYAAPDVVPHGARFERTLSLRRGERAFTVVETATFGAGEDAARQRAVRYDSFDSRDATIIDDRAHGAIGFFFGGRQTVAIATWPSADVEDAQLIAERTSTVLRLRYAAGGERRTRYALDPAINLDSARAMLLKERAAVGAKL